MQGATLALYQDGWQKGEAVGWQKGEAAGWQKGLIEGKVEGRIEGRIAVLQVLAHSLLRFLDKRFPGGVSDVLRLRIKEINDLTDLQNLLDAAIDCESVDVIEERL